MVGFILLIFLTSTPQIVVGDTLGCTGILDNRVAKLAEVEERAKRLQFFLDQRVLPPNSPKPKEQTIYFDHFIYENIGTKIYKKKIVLKKSVYMPWDSDFLTFGHNTPQGDVRNPIRILGAQLAAHLEFDIYFSADKHFIFIEVPSAFALRQKFIRLNNILRANGEELLTYLPVESEFLSALQIFDLSLSRDGDFTFLFPFADGNIELLPHEVAFHLNFIWSREITQRIRAVSEAEISLLKQALAVLRTEYPRLDFSPCESKIADTKSSRALALDGSTGTIAEFLRALRQLYPKHSYTQITAELYAPKHTELREKFEDRISFLIGNPVQTPMQNAIERVNMLIITTTSPDDDADYVTYTTRVKQVLTEIASKSESDLAPLLPPTIKEVVTQFLSSRDKFIQQLIKAAELDI